MARNGRNATTQTNDSFCHKLGQYFVFIANIIIVVILLPVVLVWKWSTSFICSILSVLLFIGYISLALVLACVRFCTCARLCGDVSLEMKVNGTPYMLLSPIGNHQENLCLKSRISFRVECGLPWDFLFLVFIWKAYEFQTTNKLF